MTDKKNEKKNEEITTPSMPEGLGKIYPVLPLRDIVLFPHMVAPLFVGREKSVHALDSVLKDNKEILLVTQLDPNVDEPAVEDLHKVGTLATILQMLRLPDGTVKVLVENVSRDDESEMLGRTSRDERVVFKADKSLIGSFVEVKIESLNGNTFKGCLI